MGMFNVQFLKALLHWKNKQKPTLITLIETDVQNYILRE